jgi:DNA-binding transcriptional MocR family regulator
VTTNKRYDIDEGIISRCINVELNGGETEQHLRVLRQHYEHLANYTDEQLTGVVTLAVVIGESWRMLHVDCDARLAQVQVPSVAHKKGSLVSSLFYAFARSSNLCTTSPASAI